MAADAPADVATDTSVDAGAEAGDAAADAAADAADAGPAGTLLLVSRNASSVTFGEWSGGSWKTSAVSLSTLSAPALVADTWGGLVVLRATAQDELTYASWSAGTWSSPAAVGTAGWTIGAPALASAGDAHLAFIGTDFKYYTADYASGAWSGSFAPVTVGANPSFGPAAPALAARGTERVLAFEGSDGDLYTQMGSSSAWQTAYAHGLTVDVLTGVSPALVARSGSTSYVAVYAETGGALMWTQGTGTAWSTPAAVASGATSASSPALVALGGGDVLLAYRGQDDKLHTSQLSGGTWSTPEAPYPTSTLTASPALARGIAGHSAEVAFISGGGTLVGSLTGSGWGTATPVVSNQQQAVAIAAQLP